MDEVYLLMYYYEYKDKSDDLKIIGVFSTHKRAMDVFNKVSKLPDFECSVLRTDPDNPDCEDDNSGDDETEDDESGFYLVKQKLDKDEWGWGSGFSTYEY